MSKVKCQLWVSIDNRKVADYYNQRLRILRSNGKHEWCNLSIELDSDWSRYPCWASKFVSLECSVYWMSEYDRNRSAEEPVLLDEWYE